MQQRVHTSRKNRDLTTDGLDKHHHEATALKVRAKKQAIQTSVTAMETRKAG
jgi:hypothetical protein